ncbi:serine/threonine-protein kinase [Spirillospora sp. NPDC046719]
MADWRLTGFVEDRELGRGAQGRVVLARHAETGAPVAIKYLTGGDPAAVAGLRAEAQMLGRLTSPYVARLFRFVESGEGAAIVMEAVNGASLKAVLAEHGRLAPEAALTVLKGSLLGLAAAHAVGVVHRDYKPANVVVRPDGLSKLVDFGVAVLAGQGSAAGTPAYMAPEQWRGEAATPATDVYAATCVFVECVTGRRPFAAGERGALFNQNLPAGAHLAHVPVAKRRLFLMGVATQAGDRPPGAAAFVGELESAAVAAYGPDWEQRGVRALAAAAVALAFLPREPVRPPVRDAAWRPSARLVRLTVAGTAFAVGYLAVLMYMPLVLLQRGAPAWLPGLALTGAAVLAPLTGRLGRRALDRLPHERVLALGTGLLAAAALVLAVGRAVPVTVAAYLAWAVADSVLQGRWQALIASIAPEPERPRWFAFFGSSWGVAQPAVPGLAALAGGAMPVAAAAFLLVPPILRGTPGRKAGGDDGGPVVSTRDERLASVTVADPS